MRRGLILIGVLITLGLSLLGASAQAAETTTVKLKSVVFAAQVGSTSGGGSVFAGAVIDRALGHGAIVFSSSAGSTKLHTTFHEYFGSGSIAGAGIVTLAPSSSGATFTVSVKVTGGTGVYRGAKGRMKGAGTLNSQNMIMMKLSGSFHRRR